MFRVTQFSDLHVRTEPAGFGPDTDESWSAVRDDAFARDRPTPDMVVVTGDIADTGAPAEYEKVGRALAGLPAPVQLLPGNHDRQVPFEAILPRPGLSTGRTLRVGPWLFLFADSNHDGRVTTDSGGVTDRDDRTHRDGRFGPAEAAWIVETIAASDADHAFLWTHHPPNGFGMFESPALEAEAAEIVRAAPALRGLGVGHSHTTAVLDLHGVPVHQCPSLSTNVNHTSFVTIPPGYRTYEFADDGSIATEVHVVEDERWPSWELPEPGRRYVSGEIDLEQMQEELGRIWNE